MKQTLSKAVVTIIIACTALYAWNHKQPVLTNVHDNEPHYECNGSSGQAGMTSCGVINNKKPTFGYVKGTCLICIEH